MKMRKWQALMLNAIYLSNSRQMLEPIMEETSEDEEHAQNSWNGYHEQQQQHRGSTGHCGGGFWSSTESETGSVIRIEVTKDIDAISERDFACPPKRPRRCQEPDQPHSLEDGVQMRLHRRYDAESHNSLERFLALEACARDSYGSQGQRSSTGSRRGGIFDDYYSDNDSFHSLSRSSSLVQFESLERQLTLQEQHQSMNSLGNSSPSLFNCEMGASASASDSNPESRRGSATSLSLMKRYESSDGRLHQTYFELNKLNFEEQQRELFAKNLLQAEIKSDSESSTSSSSDSSGHSLLSSCQGSGVASGKQDGGAARRIPLNSAENLSEDSGYCEPSTLRREKSKSIPKNFDKLCEEEEELLLEESATVVPHSKNSNGGHDLCQTKIEQTTTEATTPAAAAAAAMSMPMPLSPSSSINSSTERASSASPSPLPSPLASPSGSSAASSSSAASFTWLRNSLPDIREPRGSSSSPTSATSRHRHINAAIDPSPSSSSSTSSKCFPAENDIHGYVLASSGNPRCSRSSRSSSSSSSSSADCSPVLGATSLPNELQQLGRRRTRTRHNRPAPRNCHSNSSGGNSSSEDYDLEEEERRDDFFLDFCQQPRIRRSCSWNVGKRGLGGGAPSSAAAASTGAGYMNASYQNLTLLDYTDTQPEVGDLQRNSKRSQPAEEPLEHSQPLDMSDRSSQPLEMSNRSSLSGGDYEQIICKGNFLLDELSKIYDKNVSILNDRPATAGAEDQVDCTHKLEAEEPPQVQHVQLTIRKPPPRQKKVSGESQPTTTTTPTPKQRPNLPPAAVLSFSSFGKTFDQDPTNLRTSYAQSLEQCNFDAQEMSPTKVPSPRALPKRRFQSQAAAAKQKSLVSSTPNLSAFDNSNGETEDDIYVSSAHTSMHQLPQSANQPKPLGILLPAGSRNSFSKEVSFCPVVSKYCWQEQSSEEPQEDPGLGSDTPGHSDDDDELMDNVDATVMHNTKENENIAARYNQEQQKSETQPQESVVVEVSIELEERATAEEPATAEESLATIATAESDAEESDDNNENIANIAAAAAAAAAAEADSEPRHEPVSNAGNETAFIHEQRAVAQPSQSTPLSTSTLASSSPSPSHSLPFSASRDTAPPQRPLSLHLPILSEPPTNRAHHILYASQQLLQRYDEEEPHEREDRRQMAPPASGTVESPTKQKGGKSPGKTDDKHPSSKSFLSRFANGLRFSLRRKKKQQQQQQQLEQKPPLTKAAPVKATKQQSNGKSADFIHIPLKPPRSASSNVQTLDDSNASEASTASLHSGSTLAKTSTLQKVVTGKPPLPKQPPRLTHAPPPTVPASATHAYASEALLSAEREQYREFADQLSAGMQAARMRDTESPSRATVAQKTQMFNQLGAGSSAGAGAGAGMRPTMVTAVPVQVSPVLDDEDGSGKMGLIETNLDTHETVISGKTRSLMDITCNPLSQPHKRYLVKRLNVTSAAYDVDVDDDDLLDGDVVVNGHHIKSSPAAGGVQIASVRRPHKSMEFLLDKENQRNVLPPENELQKSHDHNPAALSEHQLRVQASLQRLNIPDWFRAYNQNAAQAPEGAASGGTSTSGGGYRPGNFTRKRTQDSGRWQGLNSKTTSLSSLGSHSQRSDRSPLLLSPSAHSHHGGQSSSVSGGSAAGGPAHGHQGHQGQQAGVGATRWSTSHLNSTQTSPSVSQRGSFARGAPINSSFMSVASNSSSVLRNSYRQPYLGWRSTEKLSQRTPHERLASSLLAQRTTPSPTSAAPNGGRTLQAVTPEIQSSIKEVTSAIVHYVNDQQLSQQQLQNRSRSASPNSRKCWLESSFVGTRPLDSPQTPVIDSSPPATAQQQLQQQQYQQYQYQQQYLNQHYPHLDATSSSVVAAGQPPLRMNGLSRIGGGGAPERSLSSASLEDVLASLLGLPSASSSQNSQNSNNHQNNNNRTQANNKAPTQTTAGDSASRQTLEVLSAAEQQGLRRRSEGDAPSQKKQQQTQQTQAQSHNQSQSQSAGVGSAAGAVGIGATTANQQTNASSGSRRVSLGDSANTDKGCGSGSQLNGEPGLQIRCRNTKCEQSASPADAKKLYKSCHNCSHLYCSRECRRAHWEKHRKACLHSRASNLCRQVLATCKDDLDSQRHLSLLARKGSISQGRGVVRVLFRSAEAAEGFIKNGFQCMGEASYVRWPDLMPAEMGLELYSELLKLSTEYKPESKMLIYVAICVVSEAPGMGQAPVRWERQLVSRCAKLKLCKGVLAELEIQQQAMQQPLAVVAVPERTEILILTFNPGLRAVPGSRELILSNILDILSRRGVLLRKHYPEIYQRLQTYTEGQTDKFHPVTLHPRDSQTGQSFVCIIMPVHTDSEFIKLPSAADGGNRVTTIDVGSPAALAKLDDDELLTRTTPAS
ncbi:uncharacterized protein LOC108161349 isoform X2 [Drosophila miranda]|uniref:uncharacterized protein LOC108161349 isoform X2 n=1 Tax=Drosophila miranda TaxID=7229 RepID=UPI00143F36C8|nr:uncharacterized protein LOC108161349 isoform X2 [Drosophila miranda]